MYRAYSKIAGALVVDLIVGLVLPELVSDVAAINANGRQALNQKTSHCT
jgi:hypothetical protein